MGGGLLQLVAYGAQDAYITGNPHITFWKVLYKRHTNFAMEAFRVNFTGVPQYGQRVVAVINRNADLMYKTYLEIVLPDTQTSATGASFDVLWTQGGQRRLGYILLKKIEVEIGGQIMDTHYGEWLYLWENLTSNVDNSTKLDAMTGGQQGGVVSTNTSCGGRPSVMYIPLQFWFCRNPGLALPLIALQYHEVRINITLSPSTDLVSKGPSFSSVSAAAAALPQLKDMSLYIDYIYLDVDERRRFAQQSHEYLIDQLQFGLQQTLSTANARIDLTLNHPVKELVWVFQDARKTDCASTTTATVGYTQPFSYDDIADRCRLQINGQDRFDERYGDYFWKVQPYQHHSGGGFWPARNEASALTATAAVPAITASFTMVSTGAGTSKEYTGLTGLLVPGMVVKGAGATTDFGVVITSNAPTSATAGTFECTSFTSTATAYTAGYSALGSQNLGASGSATVTGSIATTYQAANPINVYSFAIQPEEHQPSGTCNFSRIDTTTLVFDSVTSGGAGTYPSKAFPYNFRIYAVNYNIFRVMSGMGGLAYSN
jgi:hypothetical protein